MCGIAGIVNLDGRPVEAERLHRMASLMAHRGPDGRGFAAFPADHTLPVIAWREPSRAPRPEALSDSAVGFAHRRLAILDLTETGHQPMASPDGRYWVVLNGEIYNYAALKDELAAGGTSFRGSSDTEVLSAAWSAWGERCLDRLEGMFAFAIWDRPGQRLFLARDRFGIKPLYYRDEPGARIAFASEVKPVLVATDLPVRPDPAAAYDFLVRGRQDHRPTTFFDGILQVPPGHLVAVKARAASPRAYYDLAQAARARTESLAASGHTALFRAALESSVRSHLRSDVPVGTCLSGGLDSSSLVGLAARITGEKKAFHTFSARSRDPALDEGVYMDAVTGLTGLPNHAVCPDGDGFFDVLPDLLWHQEAPIPTGSPYAQWRVMQEASAHGVKVLLDGQGADELLGGYPGMTLAAAADALRSLRPDRALGIWWGAGPAFPRLRGLAIMLWLALRPGLPSRDRLPGGRPAFLRPELQAADPEGGEPALVGNRFLSERVRQVRLHLPALLRYEDRNSMAHGVEARVPFLDRTVAELALALPAASVLEGGHAKGVLRSACADILPPMVRDRRDKIGFATADRAWIEEARGRRLGEMLAALERAGSPWVDWPAVRRAVDAGRIPPLLIGLLTLDLWRLQAASSDYLRPRP